MRAAARMANRRSSISSRLSISVVSGVKDWVICATDSAKSYNLSIWSEYGFSSPRMRCKICATLNNWASNELPRGDKASSASDKMAAFFSAFIILARRVASSSSSPGCGFRARNSATLCSKYSRSDSLRANKSRNSFRRFSAV